MELSDLKYYERQNIKRRFGCDPLEYVKAFENQRGLCELCQQPSKRFLKPDKYKRTKQVHLLCDHCLYWAGLRKENPALITDRMMQYFELGDNWIV
ncbi:MAG: hypothetical protein WC773_04585 [Patescibacteria group bacterium]|jgi:hypothetical protein